MSRNGCFERFRIGVIIITKKTICGQKLVVKTFSQALHFSGVSGAYLTTFDVISTFGSIFGHWSKSTD